MSDQNLSEYYLSAALNQFRLIPCGDDPIMHAVVGLATISSLWEAPDEWRNTHSDLVLRLQENIEDATSRLTEALSKWLTPDYVTFSMATAVSFLTPGSSETKFDQLLHIGLIEAELKAILCRREISARGNVMLRNFQIHRAKDAAVDDHVIQ
ncbi:hypothetical protein [Oryzifoliimicrobium ureilyticus]|uniref:hypothetical protein n=1 Tax=Oryzifoliimicrobium ureilyticus TaxID=3113724 RepID=UPI003076365F